MRLGQISMADQPLAKKSKDLFINSAKGWLSSYADLEYRWSAYSVWVVEVYSTAPNATDTIAKIDLHLPLPLQFFQFGEQIGRLTGKESEESNGPSRNTTE